MAMRTPQRTGVQRMRMGILMPVLQEEHTLLPLLNRPKCNNYTSSPRFSRTRPMGMHTLRRCSRSIIEGGSCIGSSRIKVLLLVLLGPRRGPTLSPNSRCGLVPILRREIRVLPHHNRRIRIPLETLALRARRNPHRLPKINPHPLSKAKAKINLKQSQKSRRTTFGSSLRWSRRRSARCCTIIQH